MLPSSTTARYTMMMLAANQWKTLTPYMLMIQLISSSWGISMSALAKGDHNLKRYNYIEIVDRHVTKLWCDSNEIIELM